MTADLILFIIALVFCTAVIFGAICDVTTYKIPNSVSGALFVGFSAYAALRWGEMQLTTHFVIALVTFAVCFALWTFRVLGGGDLKFLTAISLWMDHDSLLPFLFVLGIGAAVFSLALIWLRRWNAYIQGSGWPRLVKQLVAKAEEHAVPYGLPVAIAALVVAPIVFGPEPTMLPHLPPVSH